MSLASGDHRSNRSLPYADAGFRRASNGSRASVGYQNPPSRRCNRASRAPSCEARRYPGRPAGLAIFAGVRRRTPCRYFGFSVASTIVPTALFTGMLLMSSARMQTRSAYLPGVSVPIWSPSPTASAAWRVVNSKTSRWLINAGASFSPLNFLALASMRCVVTVVRIWVNMSPARQTSTSPLRHGRMP